MYNENDEIVVELLRREKPYRFVELREATREKIKSEYGLLHRLALLEAAGRIVAIRTPEHKSTVYALSEAEREKDTGVRQSANESPISEGNDAP